MIREVAGDALAEAVDVLGEGSPEAQVAEALDFQAFANAFVGVQSREFLDEPGFTRTLIAIPLRIGNVGTLIIVDGDADVSVPEKSSWTSTLVISPGSSSAAGHTVVPVP